MATIAVILTKPPYSGNIATEGVEFALASTNYGHECFVVFTGKGLLQLLSQQQPKRLKSQLKQIKVMPFYDIEPVYICEASMQALNLTLSDFGLDEDDVELLSSSALHSLLTNADHTVTF